MSHHRPIPDSEAGALHIEPLSDAAGTDGSEAVSPALPFAVGIVLAWSVVLFGWQVVRVLAVSSAAALAVDAAVQAATSRRSGATGRRAAPPDAITGVYGDDNPPRAARWQALLTAALVTCTLPAQVFWPVALIASGLAVLAGRLLSGGAGHVLWHPVALARVAAEVLFPSQLHPARWPVLGPGYRAWGDLDAARELPALWSAGAALPDGYEAWSVVRPVDVLRRELAVPAGVSPAEALTAMVRDALPSGWDHLSGTAGGTIGEAGLAAMIVAGLVLMWRGTLRWPVPTLAALAAVAVAGVWPISVRPAEAPPTRLWLPLFDRVDGLPVGVVYALWQASAGELPLVVALLACEPTRSPTTLRGQALFGAMIGGLTVALRVGLGVAGAGYWALLMVNTLVPVLGRARRGRAVVGR